MELARMEAPSFLLRKLPNRESKYEAIKRYTIIELKV